MTPRLLIVADLAHAGSDDRLLATIESLAPLTSDPRMAIQVRAREVEPEHLERIARAVRERAPASARLVLNGDAARAARLGYVGVHWPERLLPEQRPSSPVWQSAAVHSLGALRRAEQARMDAVVFGTVFAPGSKPGKPAGLEALSDVCAHARVPVYAIGGVTPQRVASCLAAGAFGVATVSGVLDAAVPADRAREYLDALDEVLGREDGA